MNGDCVSVGYRDMLRVKIIGNVLRYYLYYILKFTSYMLKKLQYDGALKSYHDQILFDFFAAHSATSLSQKC